MTTDTQKSNIWLRIILLVTGGIVVSLSIYRLSNPINATWSFLGYLSISLLVVGIATIIRGISNRIARKGSRAFEVGIGIVCIIGGLYSMVYPIQESINTIRFVSLFVITYGAGLVITGFTSQKAKATRIAKISIGISIVSLTGVFVIFGGLSLILIVVFLSIDLLMTGLEIISVGITGQKITRKV